MRALFLIAGLIGIAYIVILLFPGYARTLPPPDPLAAGGALSEEARALLDNAKKLALEMVNRQNTWKLWAFWMAIAALACTTLATLVAWRRADQSRKGDEDFLNKKITTIGLLCALATIFTTGGDLVGANLVDSLDEGISTLKDVLVSVPADIAVDPANQANILNALEVTLAKYVR